MTQRVIKVLVGGDVCPVGRNLSYFRRGDAKNIFNDLLPEFEGSDLSIVNLECPLVDDNTPIVKEGPVLGVHSECVRGLKQAKIDVVNLANNHIMDHGPEGLFNTIKSCQIGGIDTVGAGKNIFEARNILIREINGIRVGILGVAEHEFSIATEASPGANPLDLIDYVRNVRANKDSIVYLIVLLHGGNEQYPYPSPRVRKTARFMIEMGANAIIVQHTHCPGCVEDYRSGHIIYGQGNLIFDMPHMGDEFYEGFLVKLSIYEDLTSTMAIIPYQQANGQVGARKMKKDDDFLLRKTLDERSLAIENDTFVRSQWIKFCEMKKDEYLNRLFGHNRFLRKLNTSKVFFRYFYSKKSLTKLQNTVSCEAHREAVETILSHGL